MGVNYAQFKDGSAYLSEDFGKQLAMKKFDLTEQQLEIVVGYYVKGKRKGLLKGMLTWTKCIKGGWVRTGPYNWDVGKATGYVATPNTCRDFQLVDAWTREAILWNKQEVVAIQSLMKHGGLSKAEAKKKHKENIEEEKGVYKKSAKEYRRA